MGKTLKGFAHYHYETVYIVQYYKDSELFNRLNNFPEELSIIIHNKLFINYKNSCFILVTKKPINSFNFEVSINHNHIQKTEYVKYLRIYVDNKLLWKVQIDKLCSKISKVIYKLRYFVSLSTLKIVYYSMFHSHLQYSLLNWGRSSKNYLQQLKILQNKVLRAILFRPKQFNTTLLYSNLNILKLDDMFFLFLCYCFQVIYCFI